MICGMKQVKWERRNSEQRNTHGERPIRPINAFIEQLENASIALKPAWRGHPVKKKPFTWKGSDLLAEREGFEPSIQV